MRGLHLGIQNHLMAGAAAVLMVASASPAMAQQTRSFNVPAGPASRTVPMFAKQAGIQIIGSADVLRTVRTNAVKGNFSVEEALNRLLAGTNLSGKQQASDVIAIGVLRSGNDQSAASDDAQAGIAEILVIGSRSRNVDVRRTEDDAQPYVVFGRKEIETSQATTVEEFLRTRLTQNDGSGGSQSQTTGNGSPFSSFNLRGLGSNQTLILVNGRRLASLADQSFAPRQADINGIPMGSIERIEVLPTSAGGIYGGNAVGGVINIILRSDYNGLEIAASYNDTFDFHAPNGRIDINGGFALEGGRTNVTFGGSISRSGTLRVRDRVDLIQKGIELGFGNVSPYQGNGTPPRGNGVNIRSADGSDLTLDPQYGGTNLGSNVTNVPLGYAGVGSDNGAALVTNAGAFNLDIPEDLLGLKRGLLTSPKVQSFNVNVRRKFSDAFDAFVDYSHLENRGLTYSVNQAPGQVFLGANAPTNPFQQSIRVTFPNPGLSFPYKVSSNTDTLSIGAIVRLPFDWAINAEFNKTWTTNSSSFYQAVINNTGLACLSSGLPCAGGPALNPLQSPIDFSPYLFPEPTSVNGPRDSVFTNPTFRASGPLFKLPGGPANLTLAIQHEATDIKRSSNIAITGSADNPAYLIFPNRKQSTTSEYAELVFPLVSPSNNVSFVNLLELRGAVRHDAYTTTAPPGGTSYIDFDVFGDGSFIYNQLDGFSAIISSDPDVVIPDFTSVKSKFKSTNFTLAGRYSPIEGIMFRASYATGFLPPSVVQISSQEFPAPFGLGIPDPQRNNEIIDYPLTQTAGLGNTSLRPEKSKSYSAGVILTPLKGLRFSADYTRIDKSDEVGGIPLDFLLANPDLFPGRVVREQSQNGLPGRIVSLDVTPINLLKSKFQSVDFQLDYDFETTNLGKFRIYGLATWQPDSIRQLIAGSQALNFSGNKDGPLKWQGNAGIDWTYANFSARWNTQYYASYNVFGTLNTDIPSGQDRVDFDVELQGARRIPSQMYSDLYLSYDFNDAKGVLNGVRVSAGMQNIFGKKPPVVAITSYTQAGYSTYGDPRLRRFTLTLRKAFGQK